MILNQNRRNCPAGRAFLQIFLSGIPQTGASLGRISQYYINHVFSLGIRVAILSSRKEDVVSWLRNPTILAENISIGDGVP